MLKIKEEVDLKELEKFGFVYIYHDKIYVKTVDDYSYEYNKIYIMPNDRIIIFGHYQDEYGATDTKNLDTLYDLIQAGLVEKVEDRR